MRSVTFAQSLTRVLCIPGCAGLAVLTLADKSATLMYAWPWWLLFWFIHLAPAVALAVRAVFDRRPLALPPGGWLWLPGLLAASELAAALASPFRAQSLLAAATPLAALATFFLLYDWLQGATDPSAARPARLERALGWFFLALLADSLGLWLGRDIVPALRGPPGDAPYHLLNLRNDHPLGHSNYTAGLAVFMLPWLAARAAHTRGRTRIGWAAAVGLALVALFTSGSRGGMIGLAAVLLALLVLSWRRGVVQLRQAMLLAAVAVLVAAGLTLSNPRIRGLLGRDAAPGPPDGSVIQRSAMLAAGWRMGADRPWLGFGPGVTPLVYPRYRAGLDGGVATALQLHCTPVQLWADTGAPGLLCALAFAALVAGAIWKNSASAASGLALLGYGVFALTDFQLDVPVFAFLLAVGAAACVPPPAARAAPRARHGLALAALGGTALIAVLGQGDPAPALNVEALAIGRDPARAGRAIDLLQQSLALNPDQGIAQFNLGWLLVVRDPPAAERHFLAAARLWPDKGGVYFGLGLARLNQDRPAEAARAFALECVNDPSFAVSPWWRVPALAALRTPTAAAVAQIYRELAARLPPGHWPGSEVRYAAALGAWLSGSQTGREVAACATTARRRDFFQRDPAPAVLLAAAARPLRYEEPGYPVVMRDPDLPPPVDLFDAQENALAAGEFAFLFPAKGWLPSPQLLEFLDNSKPPQR